MENLAKYIDEKRDVGYMIGLDRGKEKEQTKFITYFLQEDTKTLEQIATIAGTSITFVKTVQKHLNLS